MNKNDELIGNVSAIGSNMEGIVRVNDFICFVPFAIIGEKIKFKVLKITKNIAFCKLLEVLTPAEERVRPRCCVYEKCGGCQLQHLRYRDQLKMKTELVSDCLKKIANIEKKVSNCIKSDCEYEYRNKLQLPVRNTDFGDKIGFFAPNSHRIIEIVNCPLQQPWNSTVISAFNEYLSASKTPCYNEKTAIGLIRHLVVRAVDNHLLIVLVINGAELKDVDLLVEILSKKIGKFSLFLNVNTQNNNVILGEKFIHVYGKKFIETEEFDIKYQVVPESFLQVNNYVKRKLYLDVLKTVDADSETVVIDAYSGAGLMTALFGKTAKAVYGIEIVKEAVESAELLAKNNGLSSVVKNYVGSCEELLPNLIKQLRENNDKISVVLDPPRKGCDKKVLQAILSALPDKIVYVSCSPQTLARDLGVLTGSLHYEGNELKKSNDFTPIYNIEKIQPYDMFPQTKHVETLVCLTRVNHNI